MRIFFYIILLFIPVQNFAQNKMVPFDHVVSNEELIQFLDVDQFPSLKEIQVNYNKGNKQEALRDLTNYFSERFSERYFFDWKNFELRFKEYNQNYSGREQFHRNEAQRHLDIHPAYTNWKLPVKNIKGEEITAYVYRHLTRQHKADDIAMMYHYTKDINYLNYLPTQSQSLTHAFDKNAVETIDDGNGAYEVYRVGNRVYNWLMAHQILLATEEYTSEQQLEMIRTFLHSGAKLYHHNTIYSEGNHQTRGMSALAMLAILFPEIKGSENWKERSLERLEEHMEKEIYADGFQFERTVHYHMADIENYFYPYQLAVLNKVDLGEKWDQRIEGLFDVLIKIAMPNKNAPVLQDDTREPWADYNRIDYIMAMGALLFEKPEYKYFAASKVESSDYWFFKQEQLSKLRKLKSKKPVELSTCLPKTGYYIMRNGWEYNDLYMIISAGFTPEKKAHQHGDMLGIGAYAYGNVILPNYQVRYYLEDLPEFKNSWVKNVALIDSIPQGIGWKGNKGGSGFGQWDKLPVPKVLAWKATNKFDFFAGSHDGYNNLGLKTYRSVLFIKDGFWVVTDKVKGKDTKHRLQQVWQGHYDVAKEGVHARSVFPNGAGLEIIQLTNEANLMTKASARSKGRIVVETPFREATSTTTLLCPFPDFENRLIIDDYQNFKANDWIISTDENYKNWQSDGQKMLNKDNDYLFLGASRLVFNEKEILKNDVPINIWISVSKNELTLVNCDVEVVDVGEKSIAPGENITIKLENIEGK